MDEIKYLESIVKPLLKKPEGLKIDKVIDDDGILLTMVTDPEDLSTVIGRKGNTAAALRLILKIYEINVGSQRVSLKVHDPNRD